MTLTEKYIDKMWNELGIVQSPKGYSFPCPFCKHLPTKSKKIKLHKKTACFIPLRNCKYEYIFFCQRQGCNECKGETGSGGMGFLNFLYRYKPYLAEKYKFEKLHT